MHETTIGASARGESVLLALSAVAVIATHEHYLGAVSIQARRDLISAVIGRSLSHPSAQRARLVTMLCEMRTALQWLAWGRA